MATSEARIQEIIEDLRGSCNFLHATCTPEEEEDMHVLESIDAELFTCEECGWWCEHSEMNDDIDEQVCTDCRPNEE